MSSGIYALGGFVDVVVALFVWSYTSSRRSTATAISWGIATFIFLPVVIVWAIYMGVSGRNRPPAGTT